MRSHRFLLLAALAVVACGLAAAGDRTDLAFVNRLGEEVVDIRVKYATPYGEPRFDQSRVSLAAGGEYRIGVQGTTLPEAIRCDLATKTFVFDDLSGLKPSAEMNLAIVHEDGKPRLRRLDAEGEAVGVERDYLTAANRPNAVNKDDVMRATTMEEAVDMVKKEIAGVLETEGALDTFTVEAGPIWNQDNARERCPEAADEWSEEHGRDARWNGQWWTTVPGEMSVCECLTGSADEAGTLFYEDDGWGRTALFPVFWMHWRGVGRVVTVIDSSGERSAIALRFRLPAENTSDALEEMVDDLRLDGFRPVRFEMRAVNLSPDGEAGRLLEVDTDFRESKDDASEAAHRVVVALTAGYSKTRVQVAMAWIEADAFDKARSDGELPATRGVFCSLSKETLEVIFVPDGSVFM